MPVGVLLRVNLLIVPSILPMELDLDISYLGEMKLASFEIEARLRIGEGVVSILAPEPRIARFLSGLDPSEKGFQS